MCMVGMSRWMAGMTVLSFMSVVMYPAAAAFSSVHVCRPLLLVHLCTEMCSPQHAMCKLSWLFGLVCMRPCRVFD
jgi:hypothetical protein